MLAADEVTDGSIFAVGNPSPSHLDWWRWLGQWRTEVGSTVAMVAQWRYTVMRRLFLATARLGKGGHGLTVLRWSYQG